MSAPIALWSRVNKTPTCWLWTGHVGSHGYGGITRNKRRTLVHRMAWEEANGPIPIGMLVLHRCDVKRCVRPDHLFVGTQAENVRDMWSKGRGASGDRSGPRLYPERMVHPVKINLATADLIRERVQHGDRQQVVADAFGITQSMVSLIVNGRRWFHRPE